MTIRVALSKKFKLANRMVILGFLTFTVSLFFSSLFACLSLALIAFGMGYLFLGIRCPHCQNRVGQNLNNVASCFKTRNRIKFCPYCAVDLDSEAKITT
jgi:hypothetical protein